MQLQVIKNRIHEIRNQKIILDYDIAELYGISTKALKQAVRRNIDRFPPDFMFDLTPKELKNLRSQFVTSSHGGTRYNPFAFTELGVAMLSSILSNKKAIEVNIAIMRTFVILRQYLSDHNSLTDKIRSLEKKYNKQFRDVFEALDLLLQEKQDITDWKNRERIGF